MTIEPTGAGAQNLIERVKNILLKPNTEWDVIAGESPDVPKLYTGYVLPLIALAAVCAFIGTSLIGVGVMGYGYRVPIVTGVVMAVLQVAMGVAGVFVMALVTNALAPTFGSQQDVNQAHKLAAYGGTAGFLAGVFQIFPPLAALGIVGLYSLYLIYVGLPKLMKTPADKVLPYFLSIIGVMIVIGIVMATVMGAITAMSVGAGAWRFGSVERPAVQDSARGAITLPGGESVDLGDLERAAEAVASGSNRVALDPAQLQARLPQSLPGGFALVRSSSGGAMGASNAEAVYANGSAEVTLTVVDLGPMGGMAAMAGAANVQENRQDANGYSRTRTENGRIVTETVDNAAGTAEYAVITGGLSVTGRGAGGIGIDPVRAAVEAIAAQGLDAPAPAPTAKP
jgi:hypothetical protein